jgi:hypothetical protein
LRIGESLDSGFDALHRSGMTKFVACSAVFTKTRHTNSDVITGLDPVIRLLREKSLLRRLMDPRIKSGHDKCILRA